MISRTCYLVVALLVPLCLGAPAADEIASLPGWDAPLPSRQYSGYLDASQGRHIHYWFVRAESPQADSLPTTLWLNGGPGCSSLDGLFYEHGPFRVNATDPTKLYRFPFTWAKQTNMLYIEAPVGVGFSYADDPSTAYECDDDTTAEANMLALNDFFKTKFPELKKNPFFITGESYAGE